MNSTRELVRVTAVEGIGDHQLRLTFQDSTEGEIDLSALDWQGVFEPLREPAYFGSVVVDKELGTIVWPNGADLVHEDAPRVGAKRS